MQSRGERLRDIVMPHIQIHDVSILCEALPCMPFIQRLNLKLAAMSDLLLQTLGQHCTYLQSLQFVWHFRRYTKQGIKEMSMSLANSLQEVKLALTCDELEILVRELKNLRSLKSGDYLGRILASRAEDSEPLRLESIENYSIDQVEDVDLLVSLCPSLRHISIDRGVIDEDSWKRLADLLHLRSLTAEQMSVSYRELRLFLEASCERLTSLHIDSMRKLPLQLLAEYCPALETLHMACNQVNWAAVHFPNLKSFSLALPWGRKICRDNIVVIVNGAPKLVKLDLKGDIDIIDEDIPALRSMEMQEVSLCECRRLTEKAIVIFLAACPKLTRNRVFLDVKRLQ